MMVLKYIKIPWKPIQEVLRVRLKTVEVTCVRGKVLNNFVLPISAVLLSRGHVYSHAAILPDQVALLPIDISDLPTMLCSS